MKYEYTKKIQEHLEWLGYTVEDHTPVDGTIDWLLATHTTHLNLVLSSTVSGTIFFRCTVYGVDGLKRDLVDQKQLLHDINVATTFTKWELAQSESEVDRHYLITTFMLDYEKKHFGTLVESLNSDLHKHVPQLLD